MRRYRYCSVPNAPPYVARTAVDNALHVTANTAAVPLIVMGTAAGAGVSRTLKHFVESFDQRGFAGARSRLPVVVDLVAGHDFHPTIELLAVLRNGIVGAVDRSKGNTRVGAHLFYFDALYTIWTHHRDRVVIAVPLALTAQARKTRKLTKLLIDVGGGKVFDWAGDAVEVAQITLGLPIGDAADVTREKLTDRLVKWTFDNVETFIHRTVAPRSSSRLARAAGDRRLEDKEIATMLHELLIDAVLGIEADLADKASLMFFLDAIDLFDGTDPADADSANIVLRRNLLANVALHTQAGRTATVFGGRGPCERWAREFGARCEPKPIGAIPVPNIERRLQIEGLDAVTIGQIIAAFGAVSEVLPSRLRQVFVENGLMVD